MIWARLSYKEIEAKHLLTILGERAPKHAPTPSRDTYTSEWEMRGHAYRF